MRKRIIILIILLIPVFFIVKVYNDFMEADLNFSYTEFDTVNFPELQEKMYLRSKTWGLLGNHNEILISGEPFEPSDRARIEGKDYIFHTNELFYKKSGADTLIIYSDYEGNVSSIKSNKIHVLVKKFKDREERIYVGNNYENLGINRIRAVPEQETQ